VEAASNVFPFVSRYKPVVSTDLERVLRARPDLVLTADTATSDIPGLLRAAGVPVYRIYTRFETLQSIEDHIRLIGYLTGEDARAGEQLAAFRRSVQRAAARKPAGAAPPRVLAIGASYSPGSDTLFDDMIRVLGAENVAAVHGMKGYGRLNDEFLVRWDPDWIVAGADAGQLDAERARLLAMPSIAGTTAARRHHVIVFDNRTFLPLSPLATKLLDAMGDAFYGVTAP
jgi:iron complex transport system substrate-binding protein